MSAFDSVAVSDIRIRDVPTGTVERMRITVPLIWLGPLWSWRMVRPSGTRGTGSTSVGRPMRTLSRELVFVAGRPCDSPGCAVSADP